MGSPLGLDGLVFSPEWARPLDFEELQAVLAGGTVQIDMVGRAAGRASLVRVWGNIDFKHPSPFLALVPGGVLRPELLPNASFALDRNVVSRLRQWHQKGTGGEPWEAAICWLNRPGMSSSPFLAACEGAVKRLPSYAQFCSDLDDIERVTRVVLPEVDLLDTHRSGRREMMYETCVKISARGRLETKFLQRVNMFLKNIVSTRMRPARRDEILRVAADLGLQRASLVVITVLARLYDVPCAQRVLKLRDHYTDEDAHNALADIHQLEVVAGCRARVPNPVLLTEDKGLALLWAGLGFTDAKFDKRGRADVRLSPYRLFAHLPAEELHAIASGLEGRPESR